MDLTVQLGSHSYPIFLRSGASDALPAQLAATLGQRSYALVTNTTIASLYAAQIASWQKQLGFGLHTIPDGERYKTLQTWQSILDALLDARLDRKTVLLAFGGGVVGDITGFCAAAFLRGVDFVQVPTTLLAMVDSSVGGKTGVNHGRGKNLIGAFHQPRMVWIDTAYLDTLPRREFVAGYAELFKNAFIGGRDMFDFVRQNHAAMVGGDRAALVEGISRSVRIKAGVVAEDEKETSGARALLNFGHTFAHAIEHYFHYEGVLHGEAVLWGIACACELGVGTGSIACPDVQAYRSLLDALELPPLPSIPEPAALLDAMFSDKKTVRGRLRLVVPVEPGASRLTDGITAEQVMDAMRAVFGRRAGRPH